MEREQAEEVMDAVESGRPWHERIPERLGVEDGTAAGAAHYQIGSLQPIEIMQEIMTPEEFVGYLRGSVLKYGLRLGRKDDRVVDARKAAQFSKWMAQALAGEKINPREG
ncbi:MAG: DUF3310 domain-containing protein [Anaeromusa sp.]|uniref:DUF3310 domain-containing protein n=1 Tax=Anaeromusa sp. TaxID=1872520 RepID=UPI002B1F3585|nr:DUF3310 domain-containing protein [Anaeromusa sp.]MEA4835171.1 DUF3310 domain-containing protein [Anaeromusa sp.]